MKSRDNDVDMIEELISGKSVRFHKFYDSNMDKFVLFFMKTYKRDRSYCEDLYADSVTMMWEQIMRGKIFVEDSQVFCRTRLNTVQKIECSLATYVMGVGKISMLERIRKSGKTVSDESLYAKLWESGIDSADILDFTERDQLIHKALSELTPTCMEILTLFYWNEESGKEIARKTGLKNEDSVKTQKLKCMRKFCVLVKEQLKDYRYVVR